MTVLYLETSALLAWLLNEALAEQAIEKINQADLIVTSELLRVETCRALSRAMRENILSRDQYISLFETFIENLSGWFRMSLDTGVIERASEPFPAEPIRSLDAIHLASALEYKKLYPDLTMLTFNKRISENLQELGLA